MTCFLICPDSFKNSIDSFEACKAFSCAIKKFNTNFNTKYKYIEHPLSDGGEGFLNILHQNLESKVYSHLVMNHDFKKIEVNFLISKDTAIIESARIFGLNYLNIKNLDPMNFSTIGLGQLIKHIYKKFNPKKIIIGIGGSATVDLGLGMLEGLNIASFINKEGNQIKNITPKKWSNIKKIILNNQINLPKIELFCDVENNLFGKTGGIKLFSIQKGIKKNHLNDFIDLAKKIVLKIDNEKFYTEKNTGASGGIVWGFKFLKNIKIYNGIDEIINMTKFYDNLKNIDYIISGEGKTDNQTFYNKVIGKLTKISYKENIPLIVLSGAVDKEIDTNIPLFSISNGPISLEESIKNTKELITNKFYEILKLIHSINK